MRDFSEGATAGDDQKKLTMLIGVYSLVFLSALANISLECYHVYLSFNHTKYGRSESKGQQLVIWFILLPVDKNLANID